MRALTPNSGRSYRDSLMITAQVLNAGRAGANKTSIMYRARLSFEQLQRYLRRLLELGLLIYDGESRLYSATAKGILYLENFTEMQGIAEALDAKKGMLLKLVSTNGDDSKRIENMDNRGFSVFAVSRPTREASRLTA